MMEANHRRSKIKYVDLGGNLIGAVLTFVYFTFIDVTVVQGTPGPSREDLLFFVIGFGLLAIIVFSFGRRWSGPLTRYEHAVARGVVIADHEVVLVRRKAILFPYVMAGQTFSGWIGAGLLFGIVQPVMTGSFTVLDSLRSIFGITGIAGSIATVFTFFIVEHLWRQQLPPFFPHGDLSAVPGVVRLRVRTRLLVIFLMISCIPLALLGIVSYTRAVGLPHVDPVTAQQLITHMALGIVFIMAVGIAAAIGLSIYVARSVATPLHQIEAAMREVERGNLEIQCPVVSNDEIGALGEGFNRMLHGLRERDFIRATFGRYLSDGVVTALLDAPDGLQLGGELRELTMLVSDLRGFSAMAAQLAPQTVISMINRYLARMIETVTRYRGTVDEFQGDGILAFFGAPLSATDDPERAVACALAMQRAMGEINAEQRRLGLPELAMGIGINTGEVIVGNIGSEQRTKYGAMGSAINTAYRIESFTVGGQILISPSLYTRVQSLVQVRSTMEVRFKGVDHLLTLYEVTGIEGPYQVTLPDKAPEVLTTLTAPLPIVCYPLQGKVVADVAISGYLTALAVSSAHVTLEGSVAVHDNLKITLAPQGGTPLDVYAKVVALEPQEAAPTYTMVTLEWTALGVEAQNFLEHRRATVS